MSEKVQKCVWMGIFQLKTKRLKNVKAGIVLFYDESMSKGKEPSYPGVDWLTFGFKAPI